MGKEPQSPDVDPAETEEWLDALRAVERAEGPERVRFLLEAMLGDSEGCCAGLTTQLTTPYVNTIPPEAEVLRPGNGVLERRIKSLIRWNAMAMVVRANRDGLSLGGHIATYQSSATLYEVGIDRVEGQTKLLFDPETRRVLGGGIVGPHAGDLVAEITLAIELGADAEDLGLTIHPHPTLSETVALSAEAFEGTITDLYAPRKSQ